jgi:hypothetical protein
MSAPWKTFGAARITPRSAATLKIAKFLPFAYIAKKSKEIWAGTEARPTMIKIKLR